MNTYDATLALLAIIGSIWIIVTYILVSKEEKYTLKSILISAIVGLFVASILFGVVVFIIGILRTIP